MYSLVAMCLLPAAVALVWAPGTICGLMGPDRGLEAQVGACGMLWGVGSVLFGVSLARLGMAIANALVSGIVVFLGSVGPLLIGSAHVDSRQFIGLSLGLAILVVSLILCSAASISRDRVKGISSTILGSPARSIGAVLIAVLAGVLSSMLNIGFSLGGRLGQNALNHGCPAFLSTIAIWIPALLGGLILNVGYPLYLMTQRNSLPLLAGPGQSLAAWALSSLMGVLWFGNILLYGYGASVMGSAGAVYGWALSSAASILTSNVLGVSTGEWKGAGSRAKVLMTLSTVLLISSFAMLATQPLSN